MNQDTSDSMNEDLKKWLQETKNDIKKVEKTQDFSNIEPKGMCQLCGEKKSRSICIKCGKSVCNSCYFKLIGVCKKCVPQDISGKWDGSRTDWEKKLGLKWVG